MYAGYCGWHADSPYVSEYWYDKLRCFSYIISQIVYTETLCLPVYWRNGLCEVPTLLLIPPLRADQRDKDTTTQGALFWPPGRAMNDE